MRFHGIDERLTSPGSVLERHLRYWFLLVTVLGGGVGFFVSDMSAASNVPEVRAELFNE